MNITKTLALAAATAMSLGIGAAMAQDSPLMPTADDWSYQIPVTRPAPAAVGLQSGSSDVEKPAATTVSPYDYGTLNTPG
jgi:hypothetical protein